MEPYKKRPVQARSLLEEESEAHLVSLDDTLQQEQKLPKGPTWTERAAEAIKTVGCCLCTPVSCAIRYIVITLLVTLVIVAVVGAVLYALVRQVRGGDEVIDAIVNRVMSTVQTQTTTPYTSYLNRHWFALTTSPAPADFGVPSTFYPLPWAGWIEYNSNILRFNDTGNLGEVAIVLWRPGVADVATPVNRVLHLGTSCSQWCTPIMTQWLDDPTTALLAVLLTSSDTPSTDQWPTTLDRIRSRIVAAARVVP